MSRTLPALGSNERQLLLTCGRLEPLTDELERLIGRGLDWDAVLDHARLHSVAPLLRHHLRDLRNEATVPRTARRRLLELAHRASYQNDHLASSHRELSEALRERGMESIVPKGLPIAERAYGDLALRPLLDLVYLVRAEQLDDAAGVLGALGYRAVTQPATRRIYSWACPQRVFVAAKAIKTVVALFTDPVNSPRPHRLSPEGVWERSESTTVGGARTLVLSAADLVLYLCLQIDNAGYFNRVARDRVTPAELLFEPWTNNRLVRFTDLYEVLRTDGQRIDWAQLYERAGAAGLDSALATSLLLTQRLLGPLGLAKPAAGFRTQRTSWVRAHLLEGIRAELDGGTGGRIERAVARRVLDLRGHQQLGLFRLIATLELALPDQATAAMLYGDSSAALRARHTAAVALRCIRGLLTPDGES